MQIHGHPETFWIVTNPSPVSELGDICFDCDFEKFALQIKGGLETTSIVGIFADGQPAIELAEKLLEAIRSTSSEKNAHVMKSPWEQWYATQSDLDGVWLCDRTSEEKVKVKPPSTWGRNWAWNIAEDGTGIVMRSTGD